jgi:hypothetical protein
MKPTVQCLVAAVSLGLLSMQPAGVVAEARGEPAHERHDDEPHPGKRTRIVKGFPVTGVNSVLGEPLFSWGEPYGASFSFPTLARLNTSGPNPLPLTPRSPRSSVLASYVDPMFLALFNKPPEYTPDPAWLNVPLRDIPVNIDFAFVQKQALPGIREAEPLELSQVEPSQDITLGQWLNASGTGMIRCSADGANVRLHMKNLVPNRIYTVWATMGMPSQGPVPNAFPIPLGGAPNTFMTDEQGHATFKRWIKFCPLDAQAANPMLFIDVHFNAKHQTYGAVVAPGFIDGNWPGLITFSHIVFPVNVEVLDRSKKF